MPKRTKRTKAQVKALRDRAAHYSAMGLTAREIGLLLGVSRTYAWQLTPQDERLGQKEAAQ